MTEDYSAYGFITHRKVQRKSVDNEGKLGFIVSAFYFFYIIFVKAVESFNNKLLNLSLF